MSGSESLSFILFMETDLKRKCPLVFKCSFVVNYSIPICMPSTRMGPIFIVLEVRTLFDCSVKCEMNIFVIRYF